MRSMSGAALTIVCVEDSHDSTFDRAVDLTALAKVRLVDGVRAHLRKQPDVVRTSVDGGQQPDLWLMRARCTAGLRSSS